MATSSEAKFTVSLDGNAASSAKAAADAMEDLRKQIGTSQGALKQMNAQFKALQGSTAAVTTAKADLKKRMDAEREAISKATLAQIKAQEQNKRALEVGKKIAEQRKLEKEKQDALSASVTKAGGPVAALRDRLASFKEAMSTSGGRASLLAAGVVGLTAAMVALAAAGVAAGAALGAWIIKGADAARSTKLLRQAAMGGNAQWGKNFGEQVEAMARKIPVSREQLDALGKSFAANNIGGQTMVDGMEAVARVSAALGDEAAGKLKSFIDRGRQLNNFQLNPQELIGAGVTFQEVSEAMAKNLGIGIKEAQARLFQGRTKLEDGAKAMKDAVEKKFGAINAKQMISLDMTVTKLKESFSDFAASIDLEPVLGGIKDLALMFDQTTTSGQAMKQLVQIIGTDIAKAIRATLPFAMQFVYGMVQGGQQLMMVYSKVRESLKSAFGDSTMLKNVDGMKLALTAGKMVMVGLAVSVVAVGAALAALTAPMVGVIAVMQEVGDQIKAMQDAFRSGGWNGLGMYIADGITDGLKAGAIKVVDAVRGLATSAKDAFKDTLQIKSPSKVFAEYGENIAAGTAQGVDKGAPQAQGAVEAMVMPPKGGGGGGGAPVNVNLTINVDGGGKDVQGQIQAAADSAIEALTNALTKALQAGAVPVPG